MLKNIILIKLLNTIQTNMRYVVSDECKVNWDNRDTTVRNSKLHHIPPKLQLLDILRHNINRWSIQRLCYEVRGTFPDAQYSSRSTYTPALRSRLYRAWSPTHWNPLPCAAYRAI